MHPDVDQTTLAGSLQDAAIQVSREDFGQQREDIKLHGFILA
jgi:hypothetical protein